MTREDRTRWSERYAASTSPPHPPAPFLVEHAGLLVPGRTLDVASGRGRNARFLSERGHRVVAVDVARPALLELRRLAPAVDAVQMDLDHPGFRDGSFDNVVCIDFLDRRLFPCFFRWLRPGGVLLVETFRIEQARIGHPKNPDFLLARDELRFLLADFRLRLSREGAVRHNGVLSYRAGAVAVRDG